MIRRRLAVLPPEAQRLLESLSVAGGPLERGVALDAAGLGALDPSLALLLESARLMRAAASEGRSRLEIYHDQIREAIERQLTPEIRRGAARARSRARSSGAAAETPPCSPAPRGRRPSDERRAPRLRGRPSTRRSSSPSTRRRASIASRSSRTRRRWTWRSTLAQLADALANAGPRPQAAAAVRGGRRPRRRPMPRSRCASAPRSNTWCCGRIEEGKRVLIPCSRARRPLPGDQWRARSPPRSRGCRRSRCATSERAAAARNLRAAGAGRADRRAATGGARPADGRSSARRVFLGAQPRRRTALRRRLPRRAGALHRRWSARTARRPGRSLGGSMLRASGGNRRSVARSPGSTAW